jgi:hypothetical protein
MSLVKGRLIIKHDISVREEESDRLYLHSLSSVGWCMLSCNNACLDSRQVVDSCTRSLTKLADVNQAAVTQLNFIYVGRLRPPPYVPPA